MIGRGAWRCSPLYLLLILESLYMPNLEILANISKAGALPPCNTGLFLEANRAKSLQPSKFQPRAEPGKLNQWRLLKPIPLELWYLILSFASPYHTALFRHRFNVKSPLKKAVNATWYKMFKDESWLDYIATLDARPGLLESKSDPDERHLILLV